jgi:ankyrin repeat protein
MGKTVYEEALAALEEREPSLDKIQSLLTSLAALGAIDSVDNYGLTIGMHAAALGNLEAVKAAQKLSPLLERRNRHTNANLLHYAAQAVRGGAEIIEYAILEKNAPIELLSERILVQIEGREVGNGHTVAMEAVFNNNAKAIEALLAIDASGRKVDLETPTLMGWTPRGMALRDGHEFAERLPPVDDQPLDKARTAAREFATQEDDVWVSKHPSDKAAIDLVAELRNYVRSQGVARPIAALDAALASGVAVNARYGRLGQPLLNLVVTDPSMGQLQPDEQVRHAEVVGWLIERGANPRIKEMAPMAVGGGFREAVFGYREALARMIESTRPGEGRQAFIDERGPMNGYTRLNDAAFFGRTDVIELLLERGADKSIKGFNGRTPHDAAVAYNDKGTGVKIPAPVLEGLHT